MLLQYRVLWKRGIAKPSQTCNLLFIMWCCWICNGSIWQESPQISLKYFGSVHYQIIWNIDGLMIYFSSCRTPKLFGVKCMYAPLDPR
jgi:hypothetical protein